MKKRLIAIIISVCMILSFSTNILAAELAPNALSYTLENSTLYAWDPSTMLNYNCYAFAIGRTERVRQPGEFSGRSYNHLGSITDLAEVIDADLNGDLGYACVRIQVNCPDSIGIWENVIAIRKDETLDYVMQDNTRRNDYHVAKLTSVGWLHKPGGTAVLKFNQEPSNNVNWTNEAYYFGRYYPSTIIYESEIRFILYKTAHGSASVAKWTGQHYHSGSSHFYLYEIGCSDCYESFGSTTWVELPCTGPTCNFPWSVNPDPVTE